VGVGTGDDTVAGAAGMSNGDNNVWDHLKYVWETAKARGTGRRGLAPCRRGQRRCGACPLLHRAGRLGTLALSTLPCRTVVARGGGSMNPRSSPNPMRRLDDDNGLLMLMMLALLPVWGRSRWPRAYLPGYPRLSSGVQ
jgi:hypothetical protein